MIKILVSDSSRTLIFPLIEVIDDSMNKTYQQLKQDKNFNFFECFEWNDHLSDQYQVVKSKLEIPILMFTSGAYLQNAPELEEQMSKFDEVIHSNDITEFKKSDSKAYSNLFDYLVKKYNANLKPNEIAFIDDDQKNIQAASKFGFTTIHYNQPFEQDILIEFKI